MVRKRGLLKTSLTITSLAFTLGSTASHADGPFPPENREMSTVEEVRVWGERDSEPQNRRTNPASILLPEDLASINISTTEDLVRHEPSLVVRRRFIGDANGTLGIRGSNMFQTTRSMVFADGVPLHYFLESRWSGSPRWTMVSASEIAQVDILYGPFSALYSGNAMGGVINIETAIPEKREFHLDGGLFSQSFDAYGFDDTLGGYKGFASYGDRIGNLSLYASYNHLDNQSQPQTFFFGAPSDSNNPTETTGAIEGLDPKGEPQWYFGDSGSVTTRTDNIKFKVGYDWENWSTLLNLAYENRNSTTDEPNSYLQTTDGRYFWGGDAEHTGETFFVPPGRFSLSEMQRESLSAGLRLRGDLSEHSTLELTVSRFDILEDETRSSERHPSHSEYSNRGQVSDYDDTGWETADIKLSSRPTESDNLVFTAGARHEAYRLNINVFESDQYLSGEKSRLTSQSGGESQIDALFTQVDWQINRQWDLSLGGRYEDWRSKQGYFSQTHQEADEIQRVDLPGNGRRRFSPKFSLGFQPNQELQWRYSAAKAYRFPIVEELFSQYQAYNAVNEANPELKPEDGTHHNLSLGYFLAEGEISVNLFQETIRDVIESQVDIVPGGGSVRTFVPVDQVETYGIEWIANIQDFAVDNLDVRFNVAYTRSEIKRNRPDPSIVGNTFPRMPEWRSNLLATYHLSDRWHLGGSLQYSSNSFGQLDNSDDVSRVYGAQDSQTLLGLKSGYQLSSRLKISAGVDNLSDQRAYVAHPWPGRTLYFNVAYQR